MKCISLKLEEDQLEKLEEMVRESGKNRSELIRDKIFNSDTSDTGGDTKILKKMLKPFIEKGIKVNLENDEIERIKQLKGEIEDS